MAFLVSQSTSAISSGAWRLTAGDISASHCCEASPSLAISARSVAFACWGRRSASKPRRSHPKILERPTLKNHCKSIRCQQRPFGGGPAIRTHCASRGISPFVVIQPSLQKAICTADGESVNFAQMLQQELQICRHLFAGLGVQCSEHADVVIALTSAAKYYEESSVSCRWRSQREAYHNLYRSSWVLT